MNHNPEANLKSEQDQSHNQANHHGLNNSPAYNPQNSHNLAQAAQILAQLRQEISQVIAGNQELIDLMLIAIACRGHVLLEGMPGVAKTTLVKTVAQTLGLNFKRIQFTPDLLPSDLIGTSIYNPKTLEFVIKPGPVFTNIVLADEINRAPAKVQSALLECMQEQQVTIGNESFKLDLPFLVFATQNPIEQSGTYLLPEAQLDRFMFKLLVPYPNSEIEKQIIARSQQVIHTQAIISKSQLALLQELVDQVYVDEKIIEYIVKIAQATRNPAKFKLTVAGQIALGASPRASLAIYHSAKAYALMHQRQFVIPDDVKAVAPACLRHRIARSYEAQANQVSTDQIITDLLEQIVTP